MQETWVRSLGLEDLLEKEVATHSSILAWKIAGTEEPGGLQSMGLQRVGHHWVTSLSLSLLREVHHWASLVDQSVITSLRCRRPGFDPWVRMISWRRKCNPLHILAWKRLWIEEPGRHVHGVTRVRHNLATTPPPPPLNLSGIWFSNSKNENDHRRTGKNIYYIPTQPETKLLYALLNFALMPSLG